MSEVRGPRHDGGTGFRAGRWGSYYWRRLTVWSSLVAIPICVFAVVCIVVDFPFFSSQPWIFGLFVAAIVLPSAASAGFQLQRARELRFGDASGVRPGTFADKTSSLDLATPEAGDTSRASVPGFGENAGRRSVWKPVTVIAAAALLVIFLVRVSIYASETSLSFVPLIVICALGAPALVIALPTWVSNRRVRRTLTVLGRALPSALLIPAYRSIELVTYVRGKNPACVIERELVLSLDESRCAIWSGRGDPEQIMSLPIRGLVEVKRDIAHNDQRNAYPAIRLRFANGHDTEELSFFPRQPGILPQFRASSSFVDKVAAGMRGREASSAHPEDPTPSEA